MSIFKAYDIRGLAPQEINEDFAYKLGQAFVRYTKAKTVVVGKDMRKTTPELAKALTKGLTSQGADVVDIGLVTSPMLYFAVADSPMYEAGIMVTASHNPSKYNGFKLIEGDAMAIGGKRIQEVRKIFEKAPFPAKPEGNVIETEVREGYLEKLLDLADVSKLNKLKVVVDAGNGMAGVILEDLFARLSAEAGAKAGIRPKVIPLYWELDGTFPNHEANPIKEETLKDLKARVKKEKADLGIAYDGDADRVGFVDERGQTVPADLIGALLTPELLKQNPGAAVTYDVRTSMVVREEIEKAGGKPVMTPVGHAFIRGILRKRKAVFGVEYSAHFYFRDFYGVENADLPALLIMELMTRKKKKLSELIAPLRRYFHSGEINFKVLDKESLLRQIESKYKGKGKLTKIDGIRVDFKNWWFSVRASNTEPLVRLSVEAKTKKLMKSKVDELSKLIDTRHQTPDTSTGIWDLGSGI